MLTRGIRAPVFALHDVHGKSCDLWEHLGFKRMLMVFEPSESYLERARCQLASLADQDWMVLLVVSPQNPLAAEMKRDGVRILVDYDGTVALRYQAQPGTSYVVDKNGRVKQIWTAPPTPADILERLGVPTSSLPVPPQTKPETSFDRR